jgi:chromosomal replication initiator protein
MSTEKQGQQLVLNFPARPEYTFANFVVSKDSQFAYNMAKTICSGDAYNTLYISGGKGLGKTHLLIAIGNQVAEQGQQALYVHCRDFVLKIQENDDAAVNDMVKKLAAVDCFLMDDVDGIAASPAAQEKLYFIYNALLERKNKIVFTGTLNPNQLTSAESFLTSRFQWGMTAELNPLDEASRTEVIRKLSRDIGLVIPDKITDYLLNRIPRDFQSLKNAVTLINRESYKRQKKVSIALVKSALNLK